MKQTKGKRLKGTATVTEAEIDAVENAISNEAETIYENHKRCAEVNEDRLNAFKNSGIYADMSGMTEKRWLEVFCFVTKTRPEDWQD